MVSAAAALLALALPAALAVAAAIVAPAPLPLQPAAATDNARHPNLSAAAHADADASALAPSASGSTPQPVSVNSSRPQPAVVTSSWGPKRDPLYIVVPITVIYAVIFLTGIVGNISTCIVISRNKHMHTATNYYLFSLAVSDLLLLVSGLPPETYHMWSRYPYVFGEAFCVIQGFAAETSSNATVLTITAFTVERYVAICHPFQSHAVSKPSRAVKYILLIWLLALCLAVPQAMAFGLVLYEPKKGASPNPELTTCTVKRVVIPYAFQISTCVFFVAPMTLISVLYVLIGLQLRRSSVLSRRDASGSVRLKTHQHQHQQDGRKNYPKNTHSKATRHVVKMLVAVVVAFFICWAPFHAQRLLAIYGESPTRSPLTVVLYNALTYVSGVLYYLSTTVNPLLYHIMSHKFREAFKDTLARYLGRRRNREGRWRCYSVLSGRSSNTSSDLSRRPLVVSFRKPCHKQAPDPTCRRPVTVDGDPAVELLQRGRDFSSGYRDALPPRGNYHYYPQHVHHQHHPPHSSLGSLRTASYYSGLASAGHGVASGRDDDTFVTVCDSDVSDRYSSSQVQCAADVEPPYLSARDSVARLEDIEIFREERCAIQRCRRTDRLSKQRSDSSDSSKGGSAPVAQGVAPRKPRSEPQSEGASSANELEFGLRRSATTPNFCGSRRGADEGGFPPHDRRALLEVAKRNLREAVAANEFRLLCQRCRNEMRADDFYEVPYRALADEEAATAAAETQTVSPIASGDVTSDPASDAEPFVSLPSGDEVAVDEGEGVPLAPDDGQSVRDETPSCSGQLTATSSTDTEGSVPLIECGHSFGISDVEATTPALFV